MNLLFFIINFCLPLKHEKTHFFRANTQILKFECTTGLLMQDWVFRLGFSGRTTSTNQAKFPHLFVHKVNWEVNQDRVCYFCTSFCSPVIPLFNLTHRY